MCRGSTEHNLVYVYQLNVMFTTPFCFIRHLRRMKFLLETSDLNVRIAAGEILALMYEMGRDINEDFVGDNNGLCDLLRDLATDGNKHKAKKDLRQQRSSFRDILRTVEVLRSFIILCFLWTLIKATTSCNKMVRHLEQQVPLLTS